MDRWSGAMAGRLFSIVVKSLKFILSSTRLKGFKQKSDVA